MSQKLSKIFAAFFTVLSVLLMGAVPAFAVNPNTGDNFNMALVLGIAGGAVVIIIIVLALTGKKKKK